MNYRSTEMDEIELFAYACRREGKLPSRRDMDRARTALAAEREALRQAAGRVG